MPAPAPSRPHAFDAVDRPRSVGAILGGLGAAVVLVLLVVAGGEPSGGRRPEPAGTTTVPTTDTTLEGEGVVALREPPWLERPIDADVVITGFGGRLWLVDLDDGTITERAIEQDEPAFSPIAGIRDGHLVSHWDGRVAALPLAGGDPVDLAVADDRVPRPITFPSERADAVWVVEPIDPGGDNDEVSDEVVVRESTVRGEPLRSTSFTFPLFSAPVAAVGGGLLAYGQGHDVTDLDLVDIATGGRRRLLEIPREGMLVAASGSTVVTSGPPCAPGCTLTVLDVPTGATRLVPGPPDAGVRAAEGTISPDGSTLVHAVSTTVADDPRPRYVVTDLQNGTSRLTDVAVGPGVAWAADSSAFVAAPGRRGGRGLDSRLVVHHLASGETEELPVLIRMPARAPWALGG